MCVLWVPVSALRDRPGSKAAGNKVYGVFRGLTAVLPVSRLSYLTLPKYMTRCRTQHSLRHCGCFLRGLLRQYVRLFRCRTRLYPVPGRTWNGGGDPTAVLASVRSGNHTAVQTRYHRNAIKSSQIPVNCSSCCRAGPLHKQYDSPSLLRS